MRRDIVVIGASAGGLEAVARLLAPLPEDFPATVLVAIHVPAAASGDHARIVGRSTSLPTRLAEDHGGLYQGHVYVAPPDHHLLVAEQHMRVVRGPRENLSRPSIDVLFRSAATTYGPRVIGVLLTGFLDDGVAGLAAIQRRGGVTVVQDPDEAEAPELPGNALERLEIDHCQPVYRIGPLLVRMVEEEVEESSGAEGDSLPGCLEVEVAVAAGEEVEMDDQERLGSPAPFGCPECGGPLTRIEDPDLRRYRCHVGHAYSATALLADQGTQIEQAVSEAMRTLQERSHMLGDLAADAFRSGRDQDGAGLEARARESAQHASVLRRLLLEGAPPEVAAE